MQKSMRDSDLTVQKQQRGAVRAHELAELLGEGGLLARTLPGFAPRPQQLAMAERVAETLERGGVLIAEAGTGTGKTFAYLLPALLSGRKVLISTGTKALQDQLFSKDLPLLKSLLDIPVRVALLKGRANYLCRHRLDLHAPEAAARPVLAGDMRHVLRWAGLTRSGDTGELATVAEDAPVWPLVTSTADNCLGSDCPAFNDCFLTEARRAAQEADVLVVNHHLLFADMALKAEGVGEILPRVDAVIFDEAHQVPEIASQFFGSGLSSHRLLDLARDAEREARAEAADTPELAALADGFGQTVADWALGFGRVERRSDWLDLLGQAGVAEGFARVRDGLAALAEGLRAGAGRGKGLESCQRRALDLLALVDFFARHEDRSFVYWFELRGRGVYLNATPMDIAERFHGLLGQGRQALVFTSATLAVNGDFTHFQERLGLAEAETACWDSPFDYRRQAVLYVPQNLPEPRDPGFNMAVLQAALPVLEVAGGRAFMLFTSHRALNEAAGWLAARVPYPLFIQGRAPKGQLLEQFRAAGNGILLGAASFWEGVDVRGEALSCVIIDKLPFAAPDDPVLKARSRYLQEQGKDPFWDYQLPQAVIALKQGVGRLIRDPRDRGVMMICDPRLLSKGYGRVFVDSLPPMRRTRRLEVVQAFFAADAAPADGAA